MLKRVNTMNIEHNYPDIGISYIGRNDTPKSLLAGCVPKLKFIRLVINSRYFGKEIDANSWLSLISTILIVFTENQSSEWL